MRLVAALRRQPDSAPIGPPAIGEPFGGGFYFTTQTINGQTWWLVVADKSAERSLAFRASGSAITGMSRSDGLANSNTLNSAPYAAVTYCKGYVDAEGNNDYYLGALYEVVSMYQNLKPTTGANNSASDTGSNSGYNPDKVPPTAGYDGSNTNPSQTTAPAFQVGGAQALNSSGVVYWSSSTADPSASFSVRTNNGVTAASTASNASLVRPIRRILATT